MSALVDHRSDEYRQFQLARLDGLGGSDIAAILGLSKWSSPYSVWLEKTTRQIAEPSEQDQDRFDAGHDAETFLALRFQREHPGLTITSEQTKLTHYAGWAFAHVDGLVYDGKEIAGVWEAKTSTDFAPWDEVPAHYQCQVQWAMWLADLPVAYVTVGFAGWKSRTYVVERDADDIALIVETATAFWHDNVLGGIEPPVDGHPATGDALAARYPIHDDDETADLDPGDVATWRTLKADEKAIKSELGAVQNRMAAALGDAAVGVADGVEVMSYRSQTRTTTCEACGHSKQSNPFRVWRGLNKGE